MKAFAFHHQTMRRRIRNLTAGVTLAIAAVIAGQSVFAKKTGATADPATEGEWSAPFDIGIIAVHSVLLQNGKVLVFNSTKGAAGGSPAKLWDPSGTLTDVTVPYERDIFCGGQIHLADGRLMVIGGHGDGEETGTTKTD